MKDIHDQTYYELLEIEPTATQEEILKAYNRARATYGHNSPALYSLFNKEEAQELLRLIDEAYAVLSNQFRRRQYDANSKIAGKKASAVPAEPAAPIYENQITSPSEGDLQFAIPSAGDLPGFRETAAVSTSGPEPTAPATRPPDTAPSPATGGSIGGTPTGAAAAGASAAAAGAKPPGTTSFGTYKVDPAFEAEIKKTEVFSGAMIQKIRLYKNITIDQISESTKISRPYLLAVEADNYTSLPAPVFVRGFIVQIAKILGLDTNKTANSFIKLLKESPKK